MKRLLSLIVVLGAIGGCASYQQYKENKKVEYSHEIKENLFDYDDCLEEGESPFFEDIPCGDEVFLREDKDWMEDFR